MSIICGLTITVRIRSFRLFTTILPLLTNYLPKDLTKDHSRDSHEIAPLYPRNVPLKVYKLVIETLKYKSILESLITKCQIEKKEKWLGKGRCLCIVYEFLIGSGLRNMFLIIH